MPKIEKNTITISSGNCKAGTRSVKLPQPLFFNPNV